MGLPIKTEVARELMMRFPDLPSLTLGKMLAKAHPKMWLNAEKARNTVRHVRGKKIKGHSRLSNKSLFETGTRPYNPFQLPASYERDATPFKINYSRIGIISDIHVPYHHIGAITSSFTWLKKKDPDCILINGDLIDFYMASRFQPDPRMRNIAQELSDTNQLLDSLQKTFPKAKIIFKAGNHDVRLEKYLVVNAPILLDVPEFQLKNLLNLAERGIDFVDDLRLMQIGALTVLHGHEARNGITAPVNIARGLFLKTTDTALQGHNHRTSEHVTRTVRGKIIGTWSVGCLCELAPAYMPINQHNWGFAYVEHDIKTGDFEVENKKIINGKVY